MLGRLAAAAMLALFALANAAASDEATDPSKDPGTGLVGHWMLVNQADAMQIVFSDDGRFYARSANGVVRGKWALVDEEHVATWSDDSRPRRVNRFRIHGQNLVIIDADGTHHVHRRQQ